MEYRGKIENANDLVNKKYVDDSISGLATEASVTAVAGRVTTIEGAGYQTATQVSSAITAAIGNAIGGSY